MNKRNKHTRFIRLSVGKAAVLLWAVLVFAMGVLSSCTEPIELDLESQDLERLTVDAWITDQAKTHRIQLSWTSNYQMESTPLPAEGALVEISWDQTVVSFVEQIPGIYQSEVEFAAEVGKIYTLTIELEGEEYTAQTEIPSVSAMDSLGLELNPGQNPGDWPFYEIQLFTQEPDTPGDAYLWKTYVNGEPAFNSLDDFQIANDDLINGNFIPGFPIGWCVAVPGNVITVEQYSLTPETYEYFQTIMTETEWRTGVFDPPPANVSTNLSNGAVGFFVGSSVSSYSLVLP